MCMGGSPKGSDPLPPPPPAPTPTPTLVNPIKSSADRAQVLDQFKYGLASTIKTSARGVTGKGADLSAPPVTGIRTLGGGA